MTNNGIQSLRNRIRFDEDSEVKEEPSQELFEKTVLKLEARCDNWHSQLQHDDFVIQAILYLREMGYDAHPEMDCRYDVMAHYAKRNDLRLYREECKKLKDLATARRKQLEEELESIGRIEREANRAIAAIKVPSMDGILKYKLQSLKGSVARAGL